MKLILLSNGNKCLVSDEDFDKLCQYNWHMTSNGYAGVWKKTQLLMHRLILNAPKDMYVDHINHNKLDNQRENLRLVTRAQNQMNAKKGKGVFTSIYKGVFKNKRLVKRPYFSGIRVNKKLITLGYFEDEKKAAYTYNQAAKKYFGKYAKLNKI